MQFGEMVGHPFGLGAAVLNYDRQPELIIHVMRVAFKVLCWHFYDDACFLGLSRERGSGQRVYHDLQAALGTMLDPAKRQLMSCQICDPHVIYCSAFR